MALQVGGMDVPDARQLGELEGENAKLKELMSHLRHSGDRTQEACLGVISFYDSPRPWEQSLHLTRVFESMQRRANQLGYRLEPLWLKAPGMTLPKS